jgi:hypothetical protein
MATDEGQVAKYEAWAAKLEKNIEDLGHQRRMFIRIFGGAVVVSLLGFIVGWWLGVATFFTGLMICVAGVYMTTQRTLEYRRELGRTRDEVRRLRGELPPPSRAGEYEL